MMTFAARMRSLSAVTRQGQALPLGPQRVAGSSGVLRALLPVQQRTGWAWPPAGSRRGPITAGAALQELQPSTTIGLEGVLDGFQPSPALRELAAAQLRFLFTTGAFEGVPPGTRATLYVRCNSLLPGPDLQLQRVTSWPSRLPRPAWMSGSPLAGSSSPGSSADEEDVLLLSSSTWGVPDDQGPAGSSDAAGAAEASLLSEEVLLLPNTSTLVLPLASQGVLVGLLVVESAVSTGQQQWSLQQQQQQQQQPWCGSDASEPAYDVAPRGGAGSGVPWSSSTGSGGSADGSSATEDQARLDGGGAPEGFAYPAAAAACVGLTEPQLDALRAAGPMLAAACALDMRSALGAAAAAAGARKAASLLSEARGPLRAISTFGRMLVPRLEEGAPDRDMAAGIITQESRLQEVLAALDAALRPASSAWGPTTAAGAAAASGRTVGFAPPGTAFAPPMYDAALQPQPQPQPQQLGWGAREGAWQGTTAPESSTALALSDTSSAAPPAAAAGALQQPPHAAGVEAGEPAAAAAPPAAPAAAAPDAVWAPELPTALRASARDIRWSSRGPGRGSSSGGSGGSSTATYPPSVGAGAGAAAVTVDVTSDEGDEDAGTSAASARVDGPVDDRAGAAAGGAGQAALVQGSGGSDRLAASSSCSSSSQRCDVSCNLVEVVQHVLRAAAKMAAVQRVHFIVTHPLPPPRLDGSPPEQPPGERRHQPSTEAAQQPSGAGPSSSTSPDPAHPPTAADSPDSGVPELLPRPVPPLMVAVRPAVVQRSLGYVLDVALQCTPPGGQLVVTARASSGGVELCVLHSGQMLPHRLHPSSRTMAGALPAAAAAPGGLAAGGTSAADGARVAGLVSLDFAQQLLACAGARINVVYPHHFVNATSGQLEVGTSVEVWLPQPKPSPHKQQQQE